MDYQSGARPTGRKPFLKEGLGPSLVQDHSPQALKKEAAGLWTFYGEGDL